MSRSRARRGYTLDAIPDQTNTNGASVTPSDANNSSRHLTNGASLLTASAALAVDQRYAAIIVREYIRHEFPRLLNLFEREADQVLKRGGSQEVRNDSIRFDSITKSSGCWYDCAPSSSSAF